MELGNNYFLNRYNNNKILRNKVHHQGTGPIQIKQPNHIKRQNTKCQQDKEVHRIFEWEDFTD